MGLPFTEIRRACCAAGGETSESRKTWRIKGANGTGTTMRKGLVTARRWGSQAAGRASLGQGGQLHSTPLTLLGSAEGVQLQDLSSAQVLRPGLGRDGGLILCSDGLKLKALQFSASEAGIADE